MTSPESMLNNPTAGRAWFQLCLSGYRNLSASFAIVEGIVQGLLSMGIRNNVITVEEGKQVMEELRNRVWPTPGQANKAALILDLNQSMVSPLTSQVQQLAEQFDEFMLFDGFGGSELGMG